MDCNWERFNNLSDHGKLDSKPKPGILYDFYFGYFTRTSNHKEYLTLRKGLFKSFRLRHLKISIGKLREIEEEAFTEECCGQYLDTLILRSNDFYKINQNVFCNLKRLVNLDLSYNSLQFSEDNFKYLPNLRRLDLSYNKIQYLPQKFLNQVNSLEEINLGGNSIENVDVCTVDKIQSNSLTRKLRPALINLQGNKINCDCPIFYLNRYLGYKIQLTCNLPLHYKGREFNELKNEDPSSRCSYLEMEKKCNLQSEYKNFTELVSIVILLVLLVVLILVSCYCCCKNINIKNKFKALKISKNISKPNTQKPIYANKNEVANIDQEKLLS